MKRFFAICFLAAVSLGTSCIRESFEPSGDTGTQVTEVEIAISTGPALATRSPGDNAETAPGGDFTPL